MTSTPLPTESGFALFDTALGTCGVAWRGGRIAAVAFPAATRERTRARLRRSIDGPEAAPPDAVAAACSSIAELLNGEAIDLASIALDHENLPEFDRRVYEVAREIGPGKTITYGEVAQRLGDPTLAREVGAALGRNPTPLIVPCHRVVAADGRLGGFSAPGGRETKRRLLEIESAHAPELSLFT
jgi:methylated-DNA-[protein]-cysteine S-methyltransferase